jgi:calcineurin-like phosphoesterase family protein
MFVLFIDAGIDAGRFLNRRIVMESQVKLVSLKNNTQMMLGSADNIYLSSDQHFRHSNIIRFTGRPYADFMEMEEDYIRKHNETVPEYGAVWICLGDFLFLKWRPKGKHLLEAEETLTYLLKRMHGDKKIIIRGNHDNLSADSYLKCGFDLASDRDEIFCMNCRDVKIKLSHRPPVLNKLDPYDKRNELERPEHHEDHVHPKMILDITNKDYDMSHNETIREPYLCGHVHGAFRRYAKGPVVNVGVDVWDGYPVTLSEAVRVMLE